MTKTATIITLFMLMFTRDTLSMEQEKDKRCCNSWLNNLITIVERPAITYNIKQRSFKPFPVEAYDEVKRLFNLEGFQIEEERLSSLENNEHVQHVARQAHLQGLCIFRGTSRQETVQYEALTGTSITKFINGNIYHAIALSNEVCDQLIMPESIRYGIIEREIARISQAYTNNDIKNKKLYQNIGWITYTLAALALACNNPPTLYLTGLGGITVNSFVCESTELHDELALDAKAAQLAGTPHNLINTLLKSTSSIILAEKDNNDAQRAYQGQLSMNQLSLRALRISKLLQLNDQLMNKEE